MKNLFFVFVLIFAALFNACQENSITDPTQNESLEKDINYYHNLSSNPIILNTWLLDPSQAPHASVQITGTIGYGVTSNIGNQISANSTYNTVVKIKINAALHYSVPVDGNSSDVKPGNFIDKETVDYIMIDPLGGREYRLVKNYKISGCSARIFLQCTFAVTSAEVMLRDMKLCCVEQLPVFVPVD